MDRYSLLNRPLSFLLMLAVIFSLMLLAGCDSVAPEPDAGEEELITRVVLALSDGTNARTATAEDADGDGTGIAYTALLLDAGTTYTGTIRLYNDLADEELTGEVEAEGEAHQFFYTPQEGLADRLVVTPLDEDASGLPVGLEVRVEVSEGGDQAGTLNVVLSHYGNETKQAGVRSSETDLDLTFPVTIQ